jgi:hypothetical protein
MYIKSKIKVENQDEKEASYMYPYFQASPMNLRHFFDAYMADKLQNFVGREYVFNAVNEFIKNNSSGYFIIRGDPGIGKTALLAKMISEHGYIHHFNVALQNIRSTRAFLENICLQLISRYHLPYQTLPQSATDDSGFFSQCLSEAAIKQSNQPIVIAIDALDEADRTGLVPNVNSLYLPPSLPEGVYVILTSRRMNDLHLQVSKSQILDLEADSDGNLQDIKSYINKYLMREKMKTKISAWNINSERFGEALVKKSQGNFMYLYYILPAIEEGRFSKGTVDELPDGLLGYYQRHWRQMREGNEEEFDKKFQPIVCILGVAQEPITIDQISAWTNIDKTQVKHAIEKWFEFLHPVKEEGQTLYRIYHASFQDFLKEKVDLTRYDGMIADYYLKAANLK